jgi:hypothetical protein
VREVLEDTGDNERARQLAHTAGVPIVPVSQRLAADDVADIHARLTAPVIGCSSRRRVAAASACCTSVVDTHLAERFARARLTQRIRAMRVPDQPPATASSSAAP